jgi:hypothetical protein
MLECFPLLVTSGQKWECLTLRNDIAYYGKKIITTVKVFMIQAQALVINIFSSLLNVEQNRAVPGKF